MTRRRLDAGGPGGLCYGAPRRPRAGEWNNAMLKFLLWLLLLVVCWPIALLALVLWPVVWLVTIPFRILGIAVDGVLALVKAIVMLPARVLGERPARA
jgi:hypothetical protein